MQLLNNETNLSDYPTRWQRVWVFVLVLCAHGAFLWLLLLNTARPLDRRNEIWVTLNLPPESSIKVSTPSQPKQTVTAHISAAPIANPSVPSVADTIAISSLQAQASTPVTPIAPLQAVLPDARMASGLVAAQDTEPDYKAAYLANPRPEYPLVARRMAWQGRVLLRVEVRSDGRCGEVRLSESSGHAVLDNAAMNAVRHWHFVPARHGEQAVTQWFSIPVSFTLDTSAT